MEPGGEVGLGVVEERDGVGVALGCQRGAGGERGGIVVQFGPPAGLPRVRMGAPGVPEIFAGAGKIAVRAAPAGGGSGRLLYRNLLYNRGRLERRALATLGDPSGPIK